MNEEDAETKKKIAKDIKGFLEMGNVGYYLPTDEWEMVENEETENEKTPEKNPESSSSSSS